MPDRLSSSGRTPNRPSARRDKIATNEAGGDRTGDQLLHAIVAGTATYTGGAFFNALVQHLATALGVRTAFVAEFTDVKTRVHTLALWDNGAIAPNIEYDLAGTPCQQVVSGGLCLYSDNVCQVFPTDTALAEMGIRSYLGVPLLDQQSEVLGHLAVCDTKPMPPEPRCMSVFKIFADRARAELDRLRAETKLRESEQRLAGVLSSAMDAIVTIDESRRIRLFNEAAERAFGCRAAEAMGTPLDRFLTEPLRRFLAEAIPSIPAEPRLRQRYIPVEGDLHARRACGEEFPVEGTLSYARANREHLYTIILRDVHERRLAEAKLRSLSLESQYLQEEIKAEYNFEEMVGRSPAFSRFVEVIAQVAPTDAAVLITGETGTGKELVARAIHNRSARRAKPLVKVNCAALSVGLVESELFGHEKGAFTGALARRIGRFEMAHGGAIFLDEIGDIPHEVQVRLLRVLQEKEFERVGGAETITCDVRVVAATNRDLAKAVAEGKFREDLFYRLNVVPVHVPPLRDRREDVPILVRHFIERYTKRMGKPVSRVDAATMKRLMDYAWPGNVRELEHVVERAMVLSTGPVLEIAESMLPAIPAPSAAAPPGRLEDFERDHIRRVLDKTNWVIEGARGAAALLHLHPSTLRSRMKKLNITRRSSPPRPR